MNRLFLWLGLVGLLLAAGCRKDDVVDCGPTTSNLALKDFVRRNGVATQTFTINLGQTQSIATKGGAIMTFPADSFLTPTNSVASGTAQVRIREIYSVADMVLSDMPTSLPRYGSMLISGGEFNIQVGGAQRLRLQTGSTLTLQSPIPPDQDTTQQYIWNQTAAILATDTAGWQLASVLRVQSLPGLYRSLIPLDSIGWWNIDQFWHAYRSSSIASVTVTTPANQLTDTRVYLRPVGFNGLARLAPTTTGTSWQASMPVGAEMIAIVLQSVNGQLYYGTQKVSIQNNLVVTPTLAAVSEAEAVRLIRLL